eukprot:scaffold12302_cov41-Phaeocystis_antarctica.AAC.2
MRGGFPGGAGTTHASLIGNSALSVEAPAHSVAVAHQVRAAVLEGIACLVHGLLAGRVEGRPIASAQRAERIKKAVS